MYPISSRWCVRSGPLPGGSRLRPASQSSHANMPATIVTNAAAADVEDAAESPAARRQSAANTPADAATDSHRTARGAIVTPIQSDTYAATIADASSETAAAAHASAPMITAPILITNSTGH